MAASASESSVVIVGKKPYMGYRGKMKEYDIGYLKGQYYVAFTNIPYAKIPKGRMKQYQAPESLPSHPTVWPTMYEANNETVKLCTQYTTDLDPPRFVGSSDCLYLNIFLPDKPERIRVLLPVLVYIHGGGFVFGSNDYVLRTPDSIIQHGVVFVTINYRLGVFGFLSMRTKDCPGNAGLKDQVKALEWIRDNIECFMGDPNNVTISGFSAGASCVNLHLIAPASKDLFHKAILQSGGVYMPWGYRGHQRLQAMALSRHSKFCDLLSSAGESYELHEIATDLLELHRKIRRPQTFSPDYGPSVEKFREDAFLPDDLEEMMKNVEHDKPVMAGITKAEGALLFLIGKQMNYGELINDDHKFLRLLMDNFRWSHETAVLLIDRIRDKYFPERFTLSEAEKVNCLANFLRDLFFHRFYDNFKFGPDKTVHKNLYVYRFDHFSCLCRASGKKHDHLFPEPTHGDDLKYLYCPEFDKRFYQEVIDGGPNQITEIQNVMNHICSLWANFCRTGTPKSNYDPNNVEWRRHTEERPCYLSINVNLELKEEALFQDEWSWLNELVNAQPTVHSLDVTPEEEEE